MDHSKPPFFLSIIWPWDPADPLRLAVSAAQAETEAIRQAYDDAIQVEPGWEMAGWLPQAGYTNANTFMGYWGYVFFF